MRAGLVRLNARLDRLTAGAATGLFAIIFAIMLLQIAFRYLLNAPLVWTEELARYCYIWACYLGAVLALRRGSHIVIVLVAERAPGLAGWLLSLTIQLLTLVFFVVLGVEGAQLALRSQTVWAITVPIPWSVIYGAVPVAAGLMVLQTAETLWGQLAGFRAAGPR